MLPEVRTVDFIPETLLEVVQLVRQSQDGFSVDCPASFMEPEHPSGWDGINRRYLAKTTY
jgi:hypothetical protein